MLGNPVLSTNSYGILFKYLKDNLKVLESE